MSNIYFLVLEQIYSYFRTLGLITPVSPLLAISCGVFPSAISLFICNFSKASSATSLLT